MRATADEVYRDAMEAMFLLKASGLNEAVVYAALGKCARGSVILGVSMGVLAELYAAVLMAVDNAGEKA